MNDNGSELCCIHKACCSLPYRVFVNMCSMYDIYSQQKKQIDISISDDISSPHVSSYLSHPDGDTMLAEDGENSAEAKKIEPCQITS